MFLNYRTTIILLLIAIINAQSHLKVKTFAFCEGLDLEDPKKTDSEFEEARKNIKNSFSSKIDKIISFYKDDSIGDLFSSFAGFAILLILLMILACVSIFIFISFCLGKFKQPENEVKKLRFLVINIILIICFLAIFFIMIIYVRRADKSFLRSQCGLYLIPTSLIEGLFTENIRFIGFQGIELVYGHLENDIPNLKKGYLLFERIFSNEIAAPGNLAYQSTVYYKDKFLNHKTTNDKGIRKTPISVLQLTPGINYKLEQDFGWISSVALKANNAAQIGRHLNTEADDLKKQSVEFRDRLDGINNKMTAFFKKFGTKSEKAMGYGKIGYIMLIVLFLVTLIFSSVLVIILFCMTKSGECYFCKKCTKIILIFFGFSILAFLFGIFVLMVGSSSVSSFCKVYGEMNQGNLEVLKNLENPLPDDIFDVLETCYDKTSSDIYPLLTKGTNSTFLKEDFKRLHDLVNGVSYYALFIRNRPNTTYFENITDFEKNLDAINDGLISDHVNITNAINSINSEIDCNNENIQFNKENCDSSDCKIISENPSFSIPSCANQKSDLQNIYNNLKLYEDNEKELMTEMKKEFKTTKDAPLIKYEESERILEKVKDDYYKVQGLMLNTLTQFGKYNVTYDKATECHNLRNLFLKLEDDLCFEYSRNLYKIFLISLFGAILLFFMALFLFCAFRGDLEDVKNSDIKSDTSIITGNDADMDPFNDSEKIPRL